MVDDGAQPLRVTVAWSAAPRQVREVVVHLAPGATVAHALAAAGYAGMAEDAFAVWGRLVAAETVLHGGDRVEALRPLLVDPKVARRERFASQGKRTAGLFSRRGEGR